MGLATLTGHGILGVVINYGGESGSGYIGGRY
jgi:hypothetical protein